MQVNGFWQVFGAGALGAALVEAIRVANRLQTGRRSKVSLRYALASVILIAIGGAFAAIHTDQVHSVYVAVQLGIGAPAIVGAWATAAALTRSVERRFPAVGGPGQQGVEEVVPDTSHVRRGGSVIEPGPTTAPPAPTASTTRRAQIVDLLRW